MKTNYPKKRMNKPPNRELVGLIDMPKDVKEALEAMERTRNSRRNRPTFRMPQWTYTLVEG